MTYENLQIDIESGIGILSINRPKFLNALNSVVMSELSHALESLSGQNLKALIFTGAGDKAFIAGADISEMSHLSRQQAHDFARLGQLVTRRLEGFPCPVIAAVNGYALGGGCEMALACDFIIASKRAVFGQPEVGLGLITGFGGALRLAKFVGWPMAKELLFTGRRINAEQAFGIGLANRVVEPEMLMVVAKEVALEVATQSPKAVRTLKAAILEIQDTLETEKKLDIEALAFSKAFETYDQREGTKAFLEKRKPNFKGE